MKFSQENTLNIVQHSNLFNNSLSTQKLLMHVHCCLRLSIECNYKDLEGNKLDGIFNEKYPIIIDGDRLKDNYTQIEKSINRSFNSPKSVDIMFITENNELIFTEYKFNKYSFNEIFKMIEEKINSLLCILEPLLDKYNLVYPVYVLYRDKDIENIKDIYYSKLDELDSEDQESIYRKCQPTTIKDLYENFFG